MDVRKTLKGGFFITAFEPDASDDQMEGYVQVHDTDAAVKL
jgi:hypothetical protein